MGTIIVLDNITRHFSNFHFIANVQAFINCRIRVSDGASSGEVIWTALPVSFMLYGQWLPRNGYTNTMYKHNNNNDMTVYMIAYIIAIPAPVGCLRALKCKLFLVRNIP